jgi:hypothetical protein
MPKWVFSAIGAVASTALVVGLPLAGFQSTQLGIGLLVLAGLSYLFLILTLPPVAKRIKWPLLRSLVTTEKLDLIIPHLQATPADILDDNIAITTMVIYILNHSDYLAKNISVDIKFGNSLWKHDLWKASGLNSYDKLLELKDDPLISDILSKSSKQEQMAMHKRFLDHPLMDKLKPGQKIKVYLMDMNREHILKGNYFFGSMGKMTPIKPEESPGYQESQGWKEQIDNTPSGEPIRISLHTGWQNEIDKKFDQIDEFQLIRTKIGTGRSYTFLPQETEYNQSSDMARN